MDDHQSEIEKFNANLQELATALAHHEASRAAWLEFAELDRQYKLVTKGTPEAKLLEDKLRVIMSRLDELKSQLPDRFRAGLD